AACCRSGSGRTLHVSTVSSSSLPANGDSSA
ncbi:Obscurin, partial [Araneus ventricosus]